MAINTRGSQLNLLSKIANFSEKRSILDKTNFIKSIIRFSITLMNTKFKTFFNFYYLSNKN